MGKFIKSGRVVVLLQGRFAGRKAMVVKTFDDGSNYTLARLRNGEGC